jgi:hypothetical protein
MEHLWMELLSLQGKKDACVCTLVKAHWKKSKKASKKGSKKGSKRLRGMRRR